MRALPILIFFLLALGIAPERAHALVPIEISPEVRMIDLSRRVDRYEARGDRIQVETAAKAEGIPGRMGVDASGPGKAAGWLVFALTNTSSQRIERWLVTDRYSILGSGFIWPDLDKDRVVALTPSEGFRPEQIASKRADIFLLTLEPGDTVTFVAELASERLPSLHLWEASAYENSLKNSRLFQGILLGITGLLAIFLTSIFAANHKAIFPAAALVAWSVLGYLCVDYGFLGNIIHIDQSSLAFYRAAFEACIAASLAVFLYTFLRLRYWHAPLKFAIIIWVIAELSLVILAAYDPARASGIARMTFAAIGGVGTLLILYLAIRGQDRALALVPTWLLMLVWMFGAGLAIYGRLTGEFIVSGVFSGIVVLVVLLAFTVTQFAFRSTVVINGLPRNELELRAQALEGTGSAVWEWHSDRDFITTGPELEAILGVPDVVLSGPRKEWMELVHPADRERLNFALDNLQRDTSGQLMQEFRVRDHQGNFVWLQLRGQAVVDGFHKTLRCVGALSDVTETRRARERLLHDAVHDSLTGLPNRQLFFDRLEGALNRAKENAGNPPTVLFVDIDRFKNINESFGLIVGDSMLLTVARRLGRYLRPQDTLARLGGDQFAVLLVTERSPERIVGLAEQMRRSLRSPMKISGKEIVLTGSIGLAVYDGTDTDGEDLLKNAELAMYRAKSIGPDKIQAFEPSMRSATGERVSLEADLHKALSAGQIEMLYQPIVNLDDETVAGFEALMRWNHPVHGLLLPRDFLSIAEETGLIVDLGVFALDTATRQLSEWQRLVPRRDPFFISVNISSRQLLRHDLINDIKSVLGRAQIVRGTLVLEVTESLVMENPEYALEVLELVKGLGASLALDDFGTGYSSLSYLQRFPFDTVKVDKCFVGHNAMNGSSPVILKTIVALAHELEMNVVAEGAETEEDVLRLRTLGCEFAQGFYYGEPVSAGELQGYLRQFAQEPEKAPAKETRSTLAISPAHQANPAE